MARMIGRYRMEQEIRALKSERDDLKTELAIACEAITGFVEAGIRCFHCRKRLATCVGAYEGTKEQLSACDECCGHGNEDGWCVPISEYVDERKGGG